MIVSASAWPGFAAVDAVAERLRTLETLVDVLNVYDVARVDAPKPPSAVVAPLTERALSAQSVPGQTLLPLAVEMRIGVVLVVDAANDPSGRRTRAKKTLADVLGQTPSKAVGLGTGPGTGKPWGDRAAGICGRTSHRDREWSYHLAGRMDLPIQNIKGV